jgi:hypothetical protein
MKHFILALGTMFTWGSISAQECGDGVTYASQKQTEFDKRFDAYPKLNGNKGMPKFKGGDEKLDELIRSHLKLSEEARTQIFNLNFKFTITCDGRLKDVVQIGDKRADSWTNIAEIIPSSGWEPARKDGKPVDCVYFGKVMVNGSQY